jgi:hypothetical protein
MPRPIPSSTHIEGGHHRLAQECAKRVDEQALLYSLMFGGHRVVDGRFHRMLCEFGVVLPQGSPGFDIERKADDAEENVGIGQHVRAGKGAVLSDWGWEQEEINL